MLLSFADPLPNTPQFVTTPLHIRVLEGEPAFLECLVESGSQYTLTWYNKGNVDFSTLLW